MSKNRHYFQIKYVLKKIIRFLTKQIRTLPDFIIIGGRRSGNSTLYNNLTKHPYILPALIQEVSFFNFHFHKGINWYRIYFPTLARKFFTELLYRHKILIGESTPVYLFHPLAPKRAHSLLPNLKIIIMIRNPVDRAYAHYLAYKKNYIKNKLNYLSLEDYLEKSVDKYEKGLFYEIEKGKQFDKEYSFFARGVYIYQIINWLKYYPKEQILILKSEDLFSNPSDFLKKVFKFLNLPNLKLKDYMISRKEKYKKMDEKIRKRLVNLYEPHNQRLYKLVNRDYNWK